MEDETRIMGSLLVVDTALRALHLEERVHEDDREQDDRRGCNDR